MGDLFSVSWTDIACNVTASPGKTIAQITNPSTQRLWLVDINFGFDGTSATATPVLVQIVRQTTAGTPNGNTTPTPVQRDPGGPAALQTTVVAGSAAWTTEPTKGDILWHERVTPTLGDRYQWPLGREYMIAASGRVAVVVTAAATVNITGSTSWET